MELPTVPCKTCGEPTTFTGTRHCNNCHEVEIRIRDYVQSENGRKFLLRALETIDVAPLKRWIGKERARFERIYKTATGASRERAFGESNVCTLILEKIKTEQRKMRGA